MPCPRGTESLEVNFFTSNSNDMGIRPGHDCIPATVAVSLSRNESSNGMLYPQAHLSRQYPRLVGPSRSGDVGWIAAR